MEGIRVLGKYFWTTWWGLLGAGRGLLLKCLWPVISLLQPIFVFFVVISSAFCHFLKAMSFAGILPQQGISGDNSNDNDNIIIYFHIQFYDQKSSV